LIIRGVQDSIHLKSDPRKRDKDLAEEEGEGEGEGGGQFHAGNDPLAIHRRKQGSEEGQDGNKGPGLQDLINNWDKPVDLSDAAPKTDSKRTIVDEILDSDKPVYLPSDPSEKPAYEREKPSGRKMKNTLADNEEDHEEFEMDEDDEEEVEEKEEFITKDLEEFVGEDEIFSEDEKERTKEDQDEDNLIDTSNGDKRKTPRELRKEWYKTGYEPLLNKAKEAYDSVKTDVRTQMIQSEIEELFELGLDISKITDFPPVYSHEKIVQSPAHPVPPMADEMQRFEEVMHDCIAEGMKAEAARDRSPEEVATFAPGTLPKKSVLDEYLLEGEEVDDGEPDQEATEEAEEGEAGLEAEKADEGAVGENSGVVNFEHKEGGGEEDGDGAAWNDDSGSKDEKEEILDPADYYYIARQRMFFFSLIGKRELNVLVLGLIFIPFDVFFKAVFSFCSSSDHLF
jgi:hypothetical protein